MIWGYHHLRKHPNVCTTTSIVGGIFQDLRKTKKMKIGPQDVSGVKNIQPIVETTYNS